MERINATISWYQTKIGAHDKRLWEKRFEGSTTLRDIPTRDATFKGQMIDVDLIKGSTFTKVKPDATWTVRTSTGLMRVLFLPLFWRWWIRQTSALFLVLALALYALQVATLSVYLAHADELDKEISAPEVLAPLFYMAALSVIHSQIVPTVQPPDRQSRCSARSGANGGRQRRRSRRGRRRVPKGSLAPSSLYASLLREKAAATLRGVASAFYPRTRARQSSNSDEVDSGCATPNRRPSGPKGRGYTAPPTTPAGGQKVAAGGQRLLADPRQERRGRPGRDSSTVRKATFTIHDSDSESKASAVNDEHSHVHGRPVPLIVEPTRSHSPEDRGGSRPLEDKRSLGQAAASQDENGSNPLPGRGRQEAGVTTATDRLTPSSHHGESEADLSEADQSTSFHRVNTNVSDLDWESDQVQCSELNSTDTSSEFSEDQFDDSEKTDSLEEDDDDDPASLGAPHKAALPMTYFPSRADKITCFIWEGRVCKKADLSVIDIGSAIERRVREAGASRRDDYIMVAILLTALLAALPFVFHAHCSDHLLAVLSLPWTAGSAVTQSEVFRNESESSGAPYFLPYLMALHNWTYPAWLLQWCPTLDVSAVPSYAAISGVVRPLCRDVFGSSWPAWIASANACAQRATLAGLFFFLLATAERTFAERLLIAKHFTYLTSARRSKKHGVPHFRLYKVKHIKAWLSLRSYLKRRGPQRSVNVIVSSTFVLLIVTLAVMCSQLLAEHATFFNAFVNWELTLVCFGLGVFLLRLSALGTETDSKYRNLSILLTEQMNLYLQMELRPHKKEELLLANSVLKLAEDLLKELDRPFRMARFSLNPTLLNLIKVVMLSAFSAVFSELLGFKLKLYKVKLGGGLT